MGKKIGKANFWHRIGSYLSEISLEQSGSAHNEYLEVLLKNGRYQLCTENAIYSYDDRYDNFRLAFEKIHIKERNIQDSLLLGLGLGSIPYLLENTFGCSFPMTAVEIDEEVIYLAEKYVLRNLHLPIRSICTDASHFLKIDHQSYDLICMDVFKDDFIPEPFQQKLFLEDIQQRLRPNGIFLYNHLAVTNKDRQSAFQYFREVFRPFYPKGTYIDARSNFIFLNDQEFLERPA